MSASNANNSILVATATFNEAGNIVEWIQRVAIAVPKADILIVDDCSPDDTAALIREIADHDPRVHLVLRPKKWALGQRIA